MSKGNLTPTEPAIITRRAVIVWWLCLIVVVHSLHKEERINKGREGATAPSTAYEKELL